MPRKTTPQPTRAKTAGTSPPAPSAARPGAGNPVPEGTVGGLGRAPLSAAVEDYLKAIYTLLHERHPGGEGGVNTQALARELNISAPSATAMVKKLAAMNLARHTPYRGVELTEAGEKIALEVIRHHRLLETYLAQVLGLDWDQVHAEADRLEHVLSEQVEARIAEILGHPDKDPHGSPIPAMDGTITRHTECRLSDALAGTQATVSRVTDENPELLRHLSELGLRPGTSVLVKRANPAEGVLHLEIHGQERILGLAPARSIYIDGPVASPKSCS